MRIGNNEKTVLSIIKKHPDISENSLHILFLLVTGKKLRLWRTIESLREKQLIEEGKFILKNFEIKIPNLELKEDFLNKYSNIDENLRLGKKEKLILFILSKIKSASFQFLIKCTEESKENLFPVVQRLEEQELIQGYHSPIRHVNSNGKRYRPKHYQITKLGFLVKDIKLTDFQCDNKILKTISKTEKQIKQMEYDFQDILNVNQ
ncbi:hypothetical protein [Nitrosopumilus sp.]|uniref:hypothetical protein n=1 Tax=Nitrosopumilus sp. TaxID=2024843 RepID=UPI00260DA0E0|nr:hypothetical protein [Nitrosopumilus sp.]